MLCICHVQPPGHSQMSWLSKMKQRPSSGLRAITKAEVQQHNKMDDMWMCIRGKVYDVTPYIPFHPGGDEILMRGAGCDATQLYNAIHSFVNVDALLTTCCIGVLSG